MNASIEVKGTEELQKKLDEKNVKQPLEDGIKKITLSLDKEVKMATPVDTGLLRSSIFNEIAPESGRVFTNQSYAQFVEYGTKKMEARHVTQGSSGRVLGMGMFAHAIQIIQKKMGDFMKELGINIERKIDES